jgi:hypothetical protein
LNVHFHTLAVDGVFVREPDGRGGAHDPGNITLRCRAHNQHEAELEFGVQFMDARRA